MTAQSEKKFKIIEWVMRIEDDNVLNTMEEQMLQLQQASESKPSFWEAVEPIREGVSFQQLLKEQHYQPLTFEEFTELAKEVQIEEPIEELLLLLTK